MDTWSATASLVTVLIEVDDLLSFSLLHAGHGALVELSCSSVSTEALLLAVVPVPLAHLLAVHLNSVTDLDALLDIPLLRCILELSEEDLHLFRILFLPLTVKSVLEAFLLGSNRDVYVIVDVLSSNGLGNLLNLYRSDYLVNIFL